MIYHLSNLLTNHPLFNALHYTSTRCLGAIATAVIMWILFGDKFISICKKYLSADTREYVPDTHKLKGKVPTMGGIFLIGVTLLTMVLWCNLQRPSVWIISACLLLFGSIGAYDDWCKIHAQKGISERFKMSLQIGAAILVIGIWFLFDTPSTEIWLPIFKSIHPDIGMLFLLWAAWIIVGTSNAVNLTDGLDGLAAGSLVLNFATFGMIAYAVGHALIAWYLHLPFVHTAELTVIAGALVGSCVGFLWYNIYPAQLFMGDVGSLALGATLGCMTLMTKQELLLPISGILFVAETVSVVLQIFWMKRFGRRIFRMAPIHHHFELIGWPETKVTFRLTVITAFACICALALLKLR